MDKDSKLANKAKFTMKYGSDSHQERVLSKGIKATSTVRWNAAINGPKHHLDILVKDRDPEVRAAVACQGYKDHLDKLANDKDHEVRKKIPAFGHEDHLDKLLHDPHPEVRHMVRKHGGERHVKHLANDENETVAQYAKRDLETGAYKQNDNMMRLKKFTQY